MKKRSPGLTLLLIAAACVLAWAVWQTAVVGDNLQYVVDAPALTYDDNAKKHGEALTEAIDSLEESSAGWSAAIRTWTLGGVMQQATLRAGDKSATGRMELLGENAFEAHPRFLLHGRLFFEEELARGDRVILLDEQTALKLFAVADPIDRTVTFNEKTYRVVGVLRHSRRVGDYTDYGAYIPMKSVLDQTIQMDALVVEAAPIAGAGANVAFTETVTAWRPGGTVIDLGKEGMGAGLWLRVVAFLAGLAGTLRFIGWLNGSVKRFSLQYKERLRVDYAVRLMPRLIGGVLCFALGYAVAAALVALLMQFIIQPVYTFPEWIPTVLVEWSDIAAAFWNVWQTPATVLEYRTPELLRLRFLTLVTQVCSAIMGAAAAAWFGRTRARQVSMAESLRIMADSGTAVSCIRAEKTAPYEAIGYVRCGADSTLLRVVSARHALLLLPGTVREGSFNLAVEDPWIPANNVTWRITCRAEGNEVCQTGDPFDLKVPVQTLTALLYGTQPFAGYLESHADFELRMRSPVMDGFFSQHLSLEGRVE